MNITEVEEILEEVKVDMEKLEKKRVKAAAPRIRKRLQAIIKLCKAGRQEVQEMKNKI